MIVEPPVTTSILVDRESYIWYKQHEVSWRAIVKAGIRQLENGEKLLVQEQEISKLKLELLHAKRHKEMIWYVFQKHPKIYEEARAAVLKDERETI